MARRRRKSTTGKWVGRLLTALLAPMALYLIAALAGSLVPANRDWREPGEGVTIYIADNGIHADILMPVSADGLDWRSFVRERDFVSAPPGAGWIAFGSGEQRVFLDTPTWLDVRPRTIWSALAGGKRVIHVEYVQSPYYAAREIRLRPEEYRRLWAAVHSDFALDEKGRPQMLHHPGYGPSDAFFRATGRANMFRTCNAVAARWLRLAGIRVSIWPPFVNGLVWRYRRMSG